MGGECTKESLKLCCFLSPQRPSTSTHIFLSVISGVWRRSLPSVMSLGALWYRSFTGNWENCHGELEFHTSPDLPGTVALPPFHRPRRPKGPIFDTILQRRLSRLSRRCMCCSLQKIQKAKIFNFLKGTDWNAPEVVEVLIPEPQRHRRHLYMFRVVCLFRFLSAGAEPFRSLVVCGV